jgi:hypothetical protein
MVTDAFRKANIIDQIQAPSAEQAQDGLRMLNEMLADWEADGIRLGWHVVSDLEDVLPIEEQDERGVKYNLAVEICGDYGIEPLPEVARRAEDTFARFAKTSSQEVVADLSGLPMEQAPFNATWPIDG